MIEPEFETLDGENGEWYDGHDAVWCLVAGEPGLHCLVCFYRVLMFEEPPEHRSQDVPKW